MVGFGALDAKPRELPPLPIIFDGERVGVRGSYERRSKVLPLTLTLSPRKSGERERGNADCFRRG
jgi:hypothetical protein